MAEFRPGTPDQAEFLDELLDAGLLIDSGVPGRLRARRGLRGRALGLRRHVTAGRRCGESPERLAFPPLLPRNQLEKIGYLKSFPHLAGIVFAFEGDEEQAAAAGASWPAAHEDWSELPGA